MPAYALISPRIALQKGDFLGSGVPYWPLELATLAGMLRDLGQTFTVIDQFGSAPQTLEDKGDHYLQGKPLLAWQHNQGLARADACIIYAMSYMSHGDILDSIKQLKAWHPAKKIVVLENSQAVTAYALPRLAQDFFAAGADGLICGEAYFNWPELEAFLTAGGPAPANVLTPDQSDKAVTRLMERHPHPYPIPAWQHFGLQGYWSLPYAHGPKTKRFLPILTSRGCPYPCTFCVVPETNNRRWRGNSPADVVREIISLRDQYKVHDFQLEDLNPTVNSERFTAICEELITQRADVRLYIVSGTKAETVPIEQVETWYRAGVRYISISPESGSASVMQDIGKPFKYDYAARLVAACHAVGIRTQACFLVGYPTETDADLQASAAYIKTLVKAGLDEVAVFVVAAFAGSKLYADQLLSMNNHQALPSFSPKGRENYGHLATWRRRLIVAYFWGRIRFQPMATVAQIWRAALARPATKIENLPWRIIYVLWLLLRHKLKGATSRHATT